MDATGDGGTAQAQHGFVRVGARDNFYQSCAFIPMSFALVTTIGEDGETGIGPHALCFPFNVTEPYAMMLISRHTSATASNIRRTGRCALNYVEFDRRGLDAIARLGYPGQSAADKRRASPFTLDPSPVTAGGESRPRIVREAFQVLECSWDEAADIALPRGSVPREETSKFVLRVDDILLRRAFRDGVEEGRRFPSMPIFMGFRARGEFWFAEHGTPFAVAAPRVAGSEIQAVLYLANRLDESVRFTEAACARLTDVPRPFLQAALQKIIAAARERGVMRVDEAFMDAFNRARSSRADD